MTSKMMFFQFQFGGEGAKAELWRLIKSEKKTNSFSFREIENDDVDKEMRTLNSKKAGAQNVISAKILEKCASSTAPILQKIQDFNNTKFSR